MAAISARIANGASSWSERERKDVAKVESVRSGMRSLWGVDDSVIVFRFAGKNQLTREDATFS
jgi:hypothetical protein